MLTALEARDQSTQAMKERRQNIMASVESVISSAIAQGSYKANYYPRNSGETEILMVDVLPDLGYNVVHVQAKDQRDKDYLTISWE